MIRQGTYQTIDEENDESNSNLVKGDSLMDVFELSQKKDFLAIMTNTAGSNNSSNLTPTSRKRSIMKQKAISELAVKK